MSDPSILVTRPLRHNDAPSVLAVTRADEAMSPIPVVTTLQEVLNEFDEPDHDLDTDTIAFVDPDANIVAFAWSSVRDNPTRERVAHIAGRVHPDWHRSGVGRSIIEWGVARGWARLAAYPDDLPKTLRAYAYQEDVATMAAYTSCGFVPERYFFDMERDLTEAIEATELGEGLSLQPWEPTIDEQARKSHNEAFMDLWGSEPLTQERWKRWISESDSFLADGSFVVRSGDEVIGHSMNFAYREEWDEQGYSSGWIGTLGTRRSWRGRGVASALISASLEHFASTGFDRAALGVDSDNPTGAPRLYLRHGFANVRREVSLSIPISSTKH